MARNRISPLQTELPLTEAALETAKLRPGGRAGRWRGVGTGSGPRRWRWSWRWSRTNGEPRPTCGNRRSCRNGCNGTPAWTRCWPSAGGASRWPRRWPRWNSASANGSSAVASSVARLRRAELIAGAGPFEGPAVSVSGSGGLEPADGVVLRQQEAQLVDAVHQAVAGEADRWGTCCWCRRPGSASDPPATRSPWSRASASSLACTTASTTMGSRPFLRALLRKMSAMDVLITARKP